MQGLRRQGRSFALQLLYQLDISKQKDESAQNLFWEESRASEKARAFGEELVARTLGAEERIDALMTAALENWKITRLPVVVRNVIRLGICELVIIAEEPPAVVINEALELLRSYMDEESAKFANGVLEKVRELAALPHAAAPRPGAEHDDTLEAGGEGSPLKNPER